MRGIGNRWPAAKWLLLGSIVALILVFLIKPPTAPRGAGEPPPELVILTNDFVLAGKFDFDLLGLAARYYLRTDWDPEARVLTDDFDPQELESAAQRHNTTCIAGCAYPAQ